MRRLVLVAILSLSVARGQDVEEFPTKEFVELITPVMDKCRAETGVSKEIVQHFSEGKMPEDPLLKCYMKCVFLQFEVIDVKTGTVHYDKLLNFIPESMKRIAFNMGKDCIHFKGEEDGDMCQLSYEIHKCWQQKDPEHYFLL